jgi:hypothetical protein
LQCLKRASHSLRIAPCLSWPEQASIIVNLYEAPH